jgi:hypothetical protein
MRAGRRQWSRRAGSRKASMTRCAYVVMSPDTPSGSSPHSSPTTNVPTSRSHTENKVPKLCLSGGGEVMETVRRGVTERHSTHRSRRRRLLWPNRANPPWMASRGDRTNERGWPRHREASVRAGCARRARRHGCASSPTSRADERSGAPCGPSTTLASHGGGRGRRRAATFGRAPQRPEGGRE